MSKVKIYPVLIQLEWDVMYVCKRGGGGGKFEWGSVEIP